MKVKVILLWSVLIVLFTQNIFADFFNNRNQLIGERAAMLGGAYTALSEDLSGAFYNPAGIAFIDATAVSMTMSAYNYQDWSQNAPANNLESEFKRFGATPSTFGINYNHGKKLSFALSIFQTDNLKFSTNNITSDGTGSNKLTINNETWFIGPSIAFKVSNNLSIGSSLFIQYFQGEVTNATENDLLGLFFYTQNNVKSTGFLPSLGIKYYLTREFQIGLKYSAETINISGDNKVIYNFSFIPQNGRKKVKGDVRSPHQAVLGLAYDNKNIFTVSLDLIYYAEINYSEPNSMLKPWVDEYTHKEKSHFDASLGIEYYASESISLRFGIFTNSSGAQSQEAHLRVNSYGSTFGMGYSKDGTSTGLGIIVQYGTSDVQESEGAAPIIPGTASSWKRLTVTMIVGGSVMI